MKIAIISFFHPESSLCLAKHLAAEGLEVDYYTITDIVHDQGAMSGFEYKSAPKRPGICRLKDIDIPEIMSWAGELPVRWHLIRIWWFSNKSKVFNLPIWWWSLRHIKKQNYDAINIIGQHPWVRIIHKALKRENITHSLHEVGSHQNSVPTNDLINSIICDKSKVIFHSRATAKRFHQLPHSKNCRITIIPFGKFETSLLYERDVPIKHNLDLSKPTFLFYGFIKPYKGLDLLAAAMKHLSPIHDKFNMIIAGGGQDNSLPYFQAQNNCLVINRYLSNEEMMKLNRISSAVVLPYHTASQTGIIPTCFLYAKPVIATSVGAFTENIAQMQNGILVEPENPVALAKAMQECIDNESLLKKLSEGAANYGNGDEYDWKIIAKRTKDFILH